MSFLNEKCIDPRKIFVPFVPPFIGRDDLKLIFERFGTTTDVVLRPHKMKNGSFAFITYQREKDCRDVLKQEYMELMTGQKLKLVQAEILKRHNEKPYTPRDRFYDSSSIDDTISIGSRDSASSSYSNKSREQRQSRDYRNRNRPNNQNFRRNSSVGPNNDRRRHASCLRDRSSSRTRPDLNKDDHERQDSFKIPSKAVPLADLCIVIRDIFSLKFMPNGQPYAVASLCRQLKSIMDSSSKNSSMDQKENNRNESFRAGHDKASTRRPDSSGASKLSNSSSSNAEETAFLNMQFLMKTKSLFESVREAQEAQKMSSAVRMYILSNLIWLDEFLCRESHDFSYNTNHEIEKHINQLQQSVEKIKISLCTQFLNDAKKTLEDLITAVLDSTKFEEAKSWQMFTLALVTNVLEDTFRIVIDESKVVKKLGYAMIGRLFRYINDKTYNEVIENPEKWLAPSSNYFLLELPNTLNFFLQRVKEWEKKNSPEVRVGRERSYDSDGSTSSKAKSEDDLEDFLLDLSDEIEHLTQLRILLRSKDKQFEATIDKCPDISNKIITCISTNYRWESNKELLKFQTTINKKLSGRKDKDAKFERLDDDFMDGKRLFRKIKPMLQKLDIKLADEKERSLLF